MSNTITIEDVRRAFTAHVDALKRCGIEYDGRLVLSEGSKYYGNAYRINLTDFPNRCQNRQYLSDADNTVVEVVGSTLVHANWDWDHTDCPWCHGTKIEMCSGHARPPIGDDFLGMTKREAFDELTSRTRAVYDTAAALEASAIGLP